MKCPHCQKELVLGEIPELNMSRYGNRVTVATECCGKGVVATPVQSYSVSIYNGDDLEDDWGTPFKS